LNNEDKFFLICDHISFYEILNYYCKNELNTLFYKNIYSKKCTNEYYKEIEICENKIPKNKKKRYYSFFKIFDIMDYNDTHKFKRRNSLSMGRRKHISNRNAYFNDYLLKKNINHYIDIFEK
jgi:hypothetical protein